MAMIQTGLLLVLITCFTKLPFVQSTNATGEEFHWTYDDFKGWTEHMPSCGGDHQSPIDLKSDTAKVVNYPKFVFKHYHETSKEMITNNGHTLMMSFNQSGSGLPYITGGGLNGRFIFVQLHFHWGLSSKGGSEHFINSRPYSAEMHMVHYNTKYRSFEQAKKFQDGLAVLAVMIAAGRKTNKALDHLEQFDRIKNPLKAKTDMLKHPVALVELLPKDTSSFYRYNGSLTTPGCDEDVIWTVFDSPICVSERQLEKFRKLKTDEGHRLEHNFRPIQELHDRQVMYRPKDTIPGANQKKPNQKPRP